VLSQNGGVFEGVGVFVEVGVGVWLVGVFVGVIVGVVVFVGVIVGVAVFVGVGLTGGHSSKLPFSSVFTSFG